MFKKTVETKLTFNDAGIATAVASSATKEILPGTLAYLTSHLSEDTVVTGMGRTVGMGLALYAAAQLTRRQLVGDFAWNPLQAG